MGRAQDFVILVVVAFLAFAIQFVGAMALDDTRDAVTKNPDISQSYLDSIDGMYRSAVFWVPLFAQLGAVAIVAWREWRRQRVTRTARRAF